MEQHHLASQAADTANTNGKMYQSRLPTSPLWLAGNAAIAQVFSQAPTGHGSTPGVRPLLTVQRVIERTTPHGTRVKVTGLVEDYGRKGEVQNSTTDTGADPSHIWVLLDGEHGSGPERKLMALGDLDKVLPPPTEDSALFVVLNELVPGEWALKGSSAMAAWAEAIEVVSECARTPGDIDILLSPSAFNTTALTIAGRIVEDVARIASEPSHIRVPGYKAVDLLKDPKDGVATAEGLDGKPVANLNFLTRQNEKLFKEYIGMLENNLEDVEEQLARVGPTGVLAQDIRTIVKNAKVVIKATKSELWLNDLRVARERVRMSPSPEVKGTEAKGTASQGRGSSGSGPELEPLEL